MPKISEKRKARRYKNKTGFTLFLRSKRAFTLIELLISISIIAIISAIGMISYSQSQLIARDAKRKADLRSIAVALELYNQANKRYPCSGDGQVFLSTTAGFWIADRTTDGCNNASALPLNSSYINMMPKDPKNTGNPALGFYGYSYNALPDASSINPSCPSGDSQYYVLRTRLENSNDPDSCGKKEIFSCDTSTSLCPTNPSDKSLFIISSQ